MPSAQIYLQGTKTSKQQKIQRPEKGEEKKGANVNPANVNQSDGRKAVLKNAFGRIRLVFLSASLGQMWR